MEFMAESKTEASFRGKQYCLIARDINLRRSSNQELLRGFRFSSNSLFSCIYRDWENITLEYNVRSFDWIIGLQNDYNCTIIYLIYKKGK